MRKLLLIPAMVFTMGACSVEKSDFSEMRDWCASKIERVLPSLPEDYGLIPRNIAPGDSAWACRPVSEDQWAEGFWPGILWYDYEISGSENARKAAEGYTGALEFIAGKPAYDHDVGFIIFCSYGNAYRLTGEEKYRKVILETASRLAALYNPKVGTILSWPREVPRYGGHNTIMDNLMNLETLMWAAENGGDPAWKEIAISHADTTMRYNFRQDGTSYHVAVYDTLSGAHKYSCTHQGYSDDSMWARGQAWGIYGYTMMYRFTGEKRFLDFAIKVTDAYLRRLPDDLVPYWDFDDPAVPDAPKDASAAAIVASALIELDGYAPGNGYLETAKKMLTSLYLNYRSPEGVDSFLSHSVGHHPAGSEIDYSIVYADYYFIEALSRLN